MENQHRLITGYRELSAGEIAQMNRAKDIEQNLVGWIDELAAEKVADPRWLAIAKTDLQKGFMALGRAIARPSGYE